VESGKWETLLQKNEEMTRREGEVERKSKG
jgi:hypothetical protein